MQIAICKIGKNKVLWYSRGNYIARIEFFFFLRRKKFEGGWRCGEMGEGLN